MPTAGFQSGGAPEELWKSHSQLDINEEPQNVSQEAWRNVLEEEIASCALCNNKEIYLSKLASAQHPATMEDLPDELLLSIFIRLFAKQLARMRCVSKSWNALLSHSSFVKSHLDRSIHNNNQILLVVYNERDTSSDSKPCTTFSCRPPHLELTNVIKFLVNPRPEYINDITVIGSVNGLICSSYGDFVIHIWNPSLSAVLTLPPYYMPSNAHDSVRTYFRFGFDPKTNYYKVVKLIALLAVNKYMCKGWLQVEIYSMRKGSWEFITERFPSHVTYIEDNEFVFVDGHDGHLHWLCGTTEEIDSNTIVAFDLGSETFREIPLPDSTIDPNLSNELGVWSGKLCVMSWDWNVGCEVWVMEEYGVGESWVKLHAFSRFRGDVMPLGFTSHNEILLEDNERRLVLHDPIANKATIVENYRPNDLNCFVEYVDSLVWVAPAERHMVVGAQQIKN